MSAHEHVSVRERTTCYTGPVAREEVPAAHGGVCLVEQCPCGYERPRLVNGSHTEQGTWRPGAALRERWESERLARAEAVRREADQVKRRARLAAREPSWRGETSPGIVAQRTVERANEDGALVRCETWNLGRLDSWGRSHKVEDRAVTLSWVSLRAAAQQDDETLRSVYAALLADAEALAK